MKIEFLKKIGFTKTYPYGFENDEDVCGWELNLKGLSFLCCSMDGLDCGNRENLDVCVVIYESDEQVTFTDEFQLVMFIELLKKQKGRLEVMVK